MGYDDDDYDDSERHDDDDGNENNDDDDDDEDDNEGDDEDDEDDGDNHQDDDHKTHQKRKGGQLHEQQLQKQQQPPVEKERLTVHSYGAVDVRNVEDECWLIRIPQSVYDVWNKTPEGTELGDIVFTKGGTLSDGTICKPSISVQLDEALLKKQIASANEEKNKNKTSNTINPQHRTNADNQIIPLHYTLESMTKKVPVLHPFVRDSSSGRITMLGTVSRTANLQVQRNDNRYRNMLKNRLVTTMNVSKFVKPVEVTDSILRKQTQRNMIRNSSTNRNTFGDAVFQYGKRKLEALQEANNISSSSSSFLSNTNKKLKGGMNNNNKPQFESNQPIRSVLFELFQQQNFWTIKDLKTAAITGGLNVANHKRLENEIREILRDEIGIYHRSGDNKNKWELRSEFQQYGAGNSTSTGGGISGSATNIGSSNSAS